MKPGVVLLAGFALVAAGPGPHKVVRDTPSLEFRYEWPSEAVAVPALDRRFYTEAKKALAEAQANAKDDQQLAKEQKRDFNGHYYAMQWTTAGQSPRLLSLQGGLGTFEGGAHPNSVYLALLWDRSLKREIGIDSLFRRPADFAALLRAPYCKALDKERTKRREGFKMDLPDFNACPKFSELAIAPADGDGDGLFDSIDFVASPYTAGPYVEGEYEISLPVTPRLISALKPAYRASFKPQRQ